MNFNIHSIYIFNFQFFDLCYSYSYGLLCDNVQERTDNVRDNIDNKKVICSRSLKKRMIVKRGYARLWSNEKCPYLHLDN